MPVVSILSNLSEVFSLSDRFLTFVFFSRTLASHVQADTYSVEDVFRSTWKTRSFVVIKISFVSGQARASFVSPMPLFSLALTGSCRRYIRN